ncbi:MAG: glycosyltransferase [Bacteroidetes bacterium]|nr:glycosyltransferase [Bacteroidota bacterium]
MSVIIPFKNEESNLPALLMSIQDMNYEKAEFIFVNDHSTDTGAKLVEEFSNKDNRIVLIHLQHAEGKKQAVEYGVSVACNELIATTDADCVLPKSWLPGIVWPFQNPHVRLVAGIVNGHTGWSVWSVFAWLDFMSLVGTGLGSIGIGQPMYCNAANMAFRKAAFSEYIKSNTGYQSLSGDDVFLLHYIKSQYGSKAVKAVINKQSEVETELAGSFKHFINQRIRWGSKSLFYKDYFTLLVAALVFAINLNLAILLVLAVCCENWLYFGISFTGKTLIDLFFFTVVLGYFRKIALLPVVFIYQFLYFLYMTVLSPLSIGINKYRW